MDSLYCGALLRALRLRQSTARSAALAALLLSGAACRDVVEPPVQPALGPSLAFLDSDEGIPNGGMEGASASGTYSEWPPTGWGIMSVSEGYGDKDAPCYTTGFCNSGTITTRWGHDPLNPSDVSTGLFAPENPDPIGKFEGFAVLATHDVFDNYFDDPVNRRRYVMKGAVKIGVSVPTSGRPFLIFDWAFATGELNSGTAFNDVARITLRRAGQADVLLFEVSRDDLQPGGSGTNFTNLVRMNADATPRSCGTVTIRGITDEYPLCTEWQRGEIELTDYLGQQGTLLVTIEEVPYGLDGNGFAFEDQPRPSALALDNMRLSNATASLTEGVASPVSVSFPALDATVGEVLLGYDWNVPGCTVASELTSTEHVTCPDDGNYIFSVTRLSSGSTVCLNFDFQNQVCGGDYEDDEFRVYGLIQSANIAPTATFSAPSFVPVGQTYQLALGAPVDAAGDIAAGFTYAFDCGDGSFVAVSSASRLCPAAPSGSRTVRGSIADKDGGSTVYTAAVLIDDVITNIAVPAYPIPVGTQVSVTTTFNSAVGESYAAVVAWDDETPNTSLSPVTSPFLATHTYALPGVYTIVVTVQGDQGTADTEQSPQFIVVYDPSVGFVTGGGWIMSPAGALTADPASAGKATFGFSAKYLKNGAQPGGMTQFHFAAADFSFESTAYEWLVVAGSSKAQFKGTGRVNGGGSYGFLLTAIDGEATEGGGVDRFRIKIWDAGTGDVVYDNQRDDGGASLTEDSDAATGLGGGNIMIHTKK